MERSLSYNWEDLMKQADEAGGFEPLPAGEYGVECIKAVGKTAKSGRDMVTATFKVIGGPNNGRVVTNNYVLVTDKPQALQIFFRNMMVFGMSREFFAAKPSMAAVAAQMVGKKCTLDVTVEPYGDRETNQVRNTKPYSGAVAASPAPAVAHAPQPVAPLSGQNSALPAAPAPQPAEPVAAAPAPPPPAPTADPSAPPPPPF
jgi:hypothetical protein